MRVWTILIRPRILFMIGYFCIWMKNLLNSSVICYRKKIRHYSFELVLSAHETGSEEKITFCNILFFCNGNMLTPFLPFFFCPQLFI
jgi:hypothetical protein